jgi:hypothetical protein
MPDSDEKIKRRERQRGERADICSNLPIHILDLNPGGSSSN